MNIWNFNVFFGVACIIMFCINIAKAESTMKERYPELNFRKVTFLTVLRNAVEIIIVSLCPILNIIFLYALIFRDRELIESYIQETYDEYHKNDNAEVS